MKEGLTPAEDQILAQLDPKKFPRHIAIIMDGNGRWAKRRGLPRMVGHARGVDRVEDIIRVCANIPQIEVLTVYAFSTENWGRPADEVNHLMNLFRKFVREKKKNLVEKKIRVKFIGNRKMLPSDLVELMEDLEKATVNGDRLTFVMALSYGGRDEIVRAVNKALRENLSSITVEEFSDLLDTHGLPEPDLLIRTGGEQRISNFLLWQLAYTELYFTRTLWPDFTGRKLLEAIADFQRRERRFGKI